MNKTHRSVFLKDVKEAFPELRTELNSQYGLLHCEMHTFHDYVQSLIAKEDKTKLIKAFMLLEHHFKNGNDKLVNAIGVSFLEHLDLGIAKGEPSWAYQYLPNSLREPYEQLRRYHGN